MTTGEEVEEETAAEVTTAAVEVKVMAAANVEEAIVEISSLKAQSQSSQSTQSAVLSQSLAGRDRTISVSPEPPGGYKQRSRKPLEKMTKGQFKSFRDEIVQILSCLDPSLSLDHKKKWSEISDNVSKKIIPAINNTLRNKMTYTLTELKFVLQQLHRHRRDNWKISQDSNKSKLDKKRKGVNTRRSDVSSLKYIRSL
ncbi:hypothetical protein RhiirA4_488380 [Rhizophagus irregularis]|uniref:Uncharacterized protein n=1 Tax=Rhizophagus irregularis TaxID=588596 RepID=A0A2I1HTL7_9GLOM|nr:hypothetical protein RhiirA4_488380 [Rhizophagus irregularis]